MNWNEARMERHPKNKIVGVLARRKRQRGVPREMVKVVPIEVTRYATNPEYNPRVLRRARRRVENRRGFGRNRAERRMKRESQHWRAKLQRRRAKGQE